jgi:hypothetical protein
MDGIKMTLEGMASEAGFQLQNHFSLMLLRNLTGLSPSEYINKIKTEKEETGN